MQKIKYRLTVEITKQYNIDVEADNEEEAANIGMKIPMPEWAHFIDYTYLKFVEIMPTQSTGLDISMEILQSLFTGRYAELEWKMNVHERWVRIK